MRSQRKKSPISKLVLHADKARKPKSDGDKYGWATGLRRCNFIDELLFANYTRQRTDTELSSEITAEFSINPPVQKISEYRSCFNCAGKSQGMGIGRRLIGSERSQEYGDGPGFVPRGTLTPPPRIKNQPKPRAKGVAKRKQGRNAAERLKPQWRSLEKAGEFDPSDDRDARRRIQAAIVRRYGSQRFRNVLLEVYEGRCAVTGCNVPAALDAAHIKPYNGQKTNYVTNGLLLRADIHTLFDLNLLGIKPDSMGIELAPSLRGSSYEKYCGRVLAKAKDESQRPNSQALKQKWKEFQNAVSSSHG